MNVQPFFVMLARKKFPKLHSDYISSSQCDRGSQCKGITDRRTFKHSASAPVAQPENHLMDSLWWVPRLFLHLMNSSSRVNSYGKGLEARLGWGLGGV